MWCSFLLMVWRQGLVPEPVVVWHLVMLVLLWRLRLVLDRSHGEA